MSSLAKGHDQEGGKRPQAFPAGEFSCSASVSNRAKADEEQGNFNSGGQVGVRLG